MVLLTEGRISYRGIDLTYRSTSEICELVSRRSRRGDKYS